MKRVLFLCSQNMLRSPTAEAVFKHEPGWETMSAGTDVDAELPVAAEHIAWADIVVVMENHHERSVRARFAEQLEGKRLVVLKIRDVYEFMQPELVEKLRARAAMWQVDEPEAA